MGHRAGAVSGSCTADCRIRAQWQKVSVSAEAVQMFCLLQSVTPHEERSLWFSAWGVGGGTALLGLSVSFSFSNLPDDPMWNQVCCTCGVCAEPRPPAWVPAAAGGSHSRPHVPVWHRGEQHWGNHPCRPNSAHGQRPLPAGTGESRVQRRKAITSEICPLFIFVCVMNLTNSCPSQLHAAPPNCKRTLRKLSTKCSNYQYLSNQKEKKDKICEARCSLYTWVYPNK